MHCVITQYNRRNEFDHIVIETTGLANPAPIISSFYMDQDLPDRCVCVCVCVCVCARTRVHVRF